jgi:YbgC/YbaW family acyl-CoA thioester hydrolase
VTAPFFVQVRRVSFDEVDAAGIAFFATFLRWCHETMAALLDSLEGGYAKLIRARRLGLPAVHVEADFASPLRFGDEVTIAVCVERLGTSSCLFRYDVRGPAGRQAATVRHVVVLTDLDAMRSQPIPDDVRALLARYLHAPSASNDPT